MDPAWILMMVVLSAILLLKQSGNSIKTLPEYIFMFIFSPLFHVSCCYPIIIPWLWRGIRRCYFSSNFLLKQSFMLFIYAVASPWLFKLLEHKLVVSVMSQTWYARLAFLHIDLFHLIVEWQLKILFQMLKVDGLIRLMEGENTGPINIGNPGEFTMLELAENVKEVNFSWIYKWNLEFFPSGAFFSFTPSYGYLK